jgi:hypothetical protein
LAIQNGQSGISTSNNNGQRGQAAAPTNPNTTSAPAANSQNPTQATVAAEQNTAFSGSQTAAPSAGAVSAPGVGVGHAANGLPIGTSGSGLGSPEQPIGGK